MDAQYAELPTHARAHVLPVGTRLEVPPTSVTEWALLQLKTINLANAALLLAVLVVSGTCTPRSTSSARRTWSRRS